MAAINISTRCFALLAMSSCSIESEYLTFSGKCLKSDRQTRAHVVDKGTTGFPETKNGRRFSARNPQKQDNYRITTCLVVFVPLPVTVTTYVSGAIPSVGITTWLSP